MTHREEGERTNSQAHSRRVAIVGAGYVGLSSSVCLAELGHVVHAVDIDARRVAGLQQAVSPIFEPGLDDLLAKHRTTDRLRFTTSIGRAMKGAEFVFLCVATPAGANGAMDLSQVRAAAVAVAARLPARTQTVVVIKSTLPVGSADEIEALMREHAPAAEFTLITNPEFLREGRAVYDVFHPDRIVIGTNDEGSAAELANLYAGLEATLFVTDRRSAELIKQASNAFLATKISFANQLAELCERVDADVEVVAKGMGLDPRIGAGHLRAGLGFGGSCLPKDVEGLRASAIAAGVDLKLLEAVQEVNRRQRTRTIERLAEALGGLAGKQIGMWGLAFKEDTDDLRDAPALDIIKQLRSMGVSGIRAYDPQAMGAAMLMIPGVELCTDLYAAVRGADAVLLVTPWPEFKEASFGRVEALMRGKVLFDGRNQLDGAAVQAAGLDYWSVGRRHVDAASSPGRQPIEAETISATER